MPQDFHLWTNVSTRSYAIRPTTGASSGTTTCSLNCPVWHEGGLFFSIGSFLRIGTADGRNVTNFTWQRCMLGSPRPTSGEHKSSLSSTQSTLHACDWSWSLCESSMRFPEVLATAAEKSPE